MDGRHQPPVRTRMPWWCGDRGLKAPGYPIGAAGRDDTATMTGAPLLIGERSHGFPLNFPRPSLRDDSEPLTESTAAWARCPTTTVR